MRGEKDVVCCDPLKMRGEKRKKGVNVGKKIFYGNPPLCETPHQPKILTRGTIKIEGGTEEKSRPYIHLGVVKHPVNSTEARPISSSGRKKKKRWRDHRPPGRGNRMGTRPRDQGTPKGPWSKVL